MTTAGERRTGLRPRGDQRRDQIASIAAELFCERGYHGVGLGEIAGSAGITGPAIYRHFPNKRAILAHAARDFARVLTECAEEAGAGAGSPGERLDAAIGSVVRMVVERRGKIRLYQWEHRHLAAEDRAELVRTIRGLISVIAELLHQLRPDLPQQERVLLSSAALSGIASLSTHRLSLTNRAAEQVLRSVAAAVLASAPPPRERGTPADARATPPSLASRREKLIAAAVQLFHERGFHSVSMEEIGTEAGINASSVYRHFNSKADLLAAAYYRAADRLAVTSNSAIESAANAADGLRRLVRAYVHFAFSHRHLMAVYLSEYLNLPTDDRHELRKAQRDHIGQWVRLAEEARGNGKQLQTQLVVHAALNIINDGAMAGGRLADEEQTAQVALAVLEV